MLQVSNEMLEAHPLYRYLRYSALYEFYFQKRMFKKEAYNPVLLLPQEQTLKNIPMRESLIGIYKENITYICINVI